MSFDRLGSALQDAVRKLMRAPLVDEKAVRELVRDIQRALLQSDVNVQLVMDLSQRIEERALAEDLPQGFSRRDLTLKVVYEELIKLLGGEQTQQLTFKPDNPNVLMMVGIQGSGKTTSTAKLANHIKKQGLRIGVVCADNFRPGAYEQLSQLGAQIQIPVYGEPREKNAAKIAKHGLEELLRQQMQVTIVDTAGRHKQEAGLIQEMKEIAGAVKPDHIILTIDATIGQAASAQAKAFHEATPIGSIFLSKLDGAARGGGALSAVAATGAPILFVGTGEKIDEMETFSPPQYVNRLLGMGDLKALAEKMREAEIAPSKESVQAMLRGKMTLADMMTQLQAIRKMGPLGKLLKMLPGMGGKLPLGNAEVGEEKIDKWIAIMKSMTKEELNEPETIDRSRMKRIARGSGASPHDVKELVNQYFMMKKMFKQLLRSRGKLPFGLTREMLEGQGLEEPSGD